MTNKIAYLTIDDAPSPMMREKVDYLVRKKIPAVWFCIGEFLDRRPELALYAIQNGLRLFKFTCASWVIASRNGSKSPTVIFGPKAYKRTWIGIGPTMSWSGPSTRQTMSGASIA
ncbi:MAG: polysaccharide deacetylase family protein [Thermoflexales bacterium]|nr:polysaccharide deacetylase family protein [Thermoflexales bacterium]